MGQDNTAPGDSISEPSSLRLLPTPDAYSGSRGGAQHPDKRREGGHSVTIQDVAENLFPTPRATRGGSNTEIAYGLGGERSDEGRPQGEVLLPTPTASEGEKGGPNQAHGNGDRTLSGTAASLTIWGPYEAAVRRWGTVLGRPAPAPVRHDGRDGKARLNPELPEWMMGWPEGWVTDPDIGLTRAEQLKAAGNGVVPQQAVLALTELLARPGVPWRKT
jgi:DNA (cytosine-5)-methyltransferase 1